MKWDPETINDRRLLPEGDYDFEVVKAVEETNQWDQRPQLFLQFRVFLDDGNTVLISQYIKQVAAFLAAQLARSVGLNDAADEGNLDAEDLMNKTGRGFLKVRENKEGNKRNEFGRFDPPAEDPKKKTRE